jgi:hypothetical protein
LVHSIPLPSLSTTALSPYPQLNSLARRMDDINTHLEKVMRMLANKLAQ